MLRWRTASGLLVLGLWLGAGGWARADRVPSSKTVLPPSTGARTDLSVPYLAHGPIPGGLYLRALDGRVDQPPSPTRRTTLGVYHGVAPYVYGSPALTPPGNPSFQPGYNLPFYGGGRGFNPLSDGATPRLPVRVRPVP